MVATQVAMKRDVQLRTKKLWRNTLFMTFAVWLTSGMACASCSHAFVQSLLHQLGTDSLIPRQSILHSRKTALQSYRTSENNVLTWLHPATLFATSLVVISGMFPTTVLAAESKVLEQRQEQQQEQNPFRFLMGLRQEEEEVKREESDVDEELRRTSGPFSFLEKARLMNLEAVLKAEETAIKDEERDVKASKGSTGKNSAFERDAKRLGSLERLEGQLRFNDEENQELSVLQGLLAK
eukprot:TRINITY_DN108714_c0_g1_i1.p1 TRINITY_DN108714_c0_g1~~TRINITY_DN108714_c0_g1_i1.p1  ORF type:complete len:238 (+),score=49.52 TRINITY_DN108714_c0_g1_i1:22-735(+)